MRRAGVIVLLVAGLGGAAFFYLLETSYLDARLRAAQFRAKTLADACEEYYLTPEAKNQYPQSLADLVKPPFGDKPFLRHMERAPLYDPCGKPYQYEVRTKSDGTQYPFVFTVTDKGVKISQFGIGPKAEPPF